MSRALPPHREKVVLPANVERTIGERRRSHQHLTHRVGGDDLEFVRGPDDKHITVFTQKEHFPVGSHRRGGEARPGMRYALAELLVARAKVVQWET